MSKPSSRSRSARRDIAIAPRGLQLQYPVAKIAAGAIAIQKVAQQMDRMAVQLGGKLDAAHQLEARRGAPVRAPGRSPRTCRGR